MQNPSDAAYTPGVTPQHTAEERLALMRAHGVPLEMDELLGRFGVSPLAAKMGIVFEDVDPARMSASMPVAGNEQNAGLLHGGAHLVLGETLGSTAAFLHAAQVHGEPRPVVGIEISASHHRGVRAGHVHALCTPIHLGRTLTTHEVVVRDDDGRRVSTIRISNMILDAPTG